MTWTFAGRDRGGMADQGDQRELVTGLDPQDAKAILGVLVGDALDQSGEHFVVGWCGLVLHDRRHTLAVLSKAARNLVAHPPTDAAGPSCASKCPISVKARLVSPRSALMFRAQILGKSPSGRAKFNRKVRYPAGGGSCPRICPRHRSGPAW